MGLMAFIGIIWLVYNLLKEALEPTIPADYFKNQKLYYDDIMNPDVNFDDVMKNLENGKYRG